MRMHAGDTSYHGHSVILMTDNFQKVAAAAAVTVISRPSVSAVRRAAYSAWPVEDTLQWFRRQSDVGRCT